jgi:hypothetical protein
MMLFRTGILLLFLLAAGCSFDQDGAYYPDQSEGYLLYQDAQGAKRLALIEGEDFSLDWQLSLGLEAGELSDLAGDSRELWLSSGPRQRLLRWQQAVLDSFSLSNFAPHVLAVGDAYLLLGDTTRQLWGFWDREARQLVYTYPAQGSPGPITYRNGKFFAREGARRFVLFHERSLASLGEVIFEHPIVGQQIGRGSQVLVYTQDSLLYEQAIDYNSNRLANQFQAFSFDFIFRSPFYRSQYSREWLSDLILNDGRLVVTQPRFVLAEGVADAQVDFFDSKVLFRRNDSLFQQGILDARPFFVSPFPYAMQKYWALHTSEVEAGK